MLASISAAPELFNMFSLKGHNLSPPATLVSVCVVKFYVLQTIKAFAT